MTRRMTLLLTMLVLSLVMVACGGTESPTATPEPAATEAPTLEAPDDEATVTNAVAVTDQPLTEGNTVTIESVTSDTAGWLVIHAQADGAPGPVLGHAPVAAGENSDVVVEIDPAGATETLYAMLHIDAGTAGEYEFPGDDGPARDADGNVVTPPFMITSGLPEAAVPGDGASLLNVSESDELGPYLIDSQGMTLYLFDNDEPGLSNCYDDCAAAWPPLLVADADSVSAAEDINGELGTTERTDGTVQVTYNGWPLYYWISDQAPGDTTGHGVGEVWWVVEP